MRTNQSNQVTRPPRTRPSSASPQIMQSVAVAASLVLALACQLFAQLEFKGNVASLFTDERAFKVGDVIAVEINERVQGINNAQFRSQRGTDVQAEFGAGAGKVFGLLNPFGGQISSTNDFDSRVQNNKLSTFTTQISTRVVNVDELGNLYLEGSKVIEMPDEKQVVVITGVARSRDITNQNTVGSSQLANLQVTMKGKGEAEDSRRPTLFNRILSWFF